MAADQKFSQFTPVGDMQVGDQPVGLRSGANVRFDFPGTGIKDANGNILLQWATTGISAVNWPKVINSLPGTAVQYTAEGDDTDISIEIRPKGTGGLKLDDINWPLSPGAVGSFAYMVNATDLGFTASPVVTSLTGTANQVLVNGTFGVATGGPVILTTPQDIAPTSSPTFNALTLTTPLSMASGGSNKALTASAGGIVWTDSNSMEVLAGTATALQMLQSGNLATPTWSTATWPATTTINQLLYSSAANTVTGLSTVNSAILFTNSTGVPAWSASLTNGQLMIGSTGASPVPATLTAGSGVSITNGPGSITISDISGGMVWTEVVGTTQAISVDNGYVSNNAGLVTFTLPAIAAFGTFFKIVGKGAGGWSIAQNAGQNIQVGNTSSSIGAGGSVSSTNRFDAITLVCTTANTTWTAEVAPQSAGLNIV